MSTDVHILAAHPRLQRVLLVCVVIVAVVLAGRAVGAAVGLVRPIVVPLGIALLLTGLLMPVQLLLNRLLRLPRTLAATLTLLLAAGGVGAVLYLSGNQLAQGVADVSRTAALELGTIKGWIADSPLPVGRQDLDAAIDAAIAWLQDNGSGLALGMIGAGSSVLNGVLGLFVTLVSTFFFLAEGDRIFAWLVLLLPRDWRERAFQGGRRGWVTLGTYTKMQMVLAGADAIGIGAGAAVLGLPFVIPLTAITFILCFIPVVGAVVSGGLVLLVALAFKGTSAAIVMLVVVVVVQQVESSLLGPIVMGKAVSLHPLAILLAVAGGSYLLGLLGALFAVPLVATLNTIALYLAGRDPFPGLAAGGSALLNRPGSLAAGVPSPRVPPRLGDATPSWLAVARRPPTRNDAETTEDAPR